MQGRGHHGTGRCRRCRGGAITAQGGATGAAMGAWGHNGTGRSHQPTTVQRGSYNSMEAEPLQHGPEAAPAAKSEGCQPNHFGLGLGFGYGRVGCSFLWCTIFFAFLLCHVPSPMVSGRSGSSRHVRVPMLGFEKSSD